MIPQSVLSVALFLLLVAPGLLFEGVRGRYRHPLRQTPFREAGRVTLASLVFSGCALGVLGVFRSTWPGSIPDLGKWLQKPKPRAVSYVASHYRLIARTVALEFVVAGLLACLSAFLFYRHKRSAIVPDPLLSQMIHKARPKSDDLPAASVLMKSGKLYTGLVAGIDNGDTWSESAIALGAPLTIVSTAELLRIAEIPHCRSPKFPRR